MAAWSSRRVGGIVLAVGVTVALLVGGYLAFVRSSRNLPLAGSPDPRVEYSGPFENINPSVHYVAESRCAQCHPKEAQSFAQHPMGRSLFPVATAPAPPTDRAHNNPFNALESQFQVERRDDRLWHRRVKSTPDGQTAAETTWEVDFVMGSGTRGYSYLCSRDGYLRQTPISWYSQKKVWDLSPGFGPATATGRPVVPDCLYCHANRARHIENTANRYAEPVFEGFAIGCQRCHGPGERHVAARERGEALGRPDHTIVNPRHLEPATRAAVCEQCHLQGKLRFPTRGRDVDDYRPGLPLELFWTVLNRPPDSGDSQKAVGQVEQMYQSRCFQATKGGLGCVSCHDPHVRVEPQDRVTHYRQSCLKCHEQRGCRLPVEQRLKQSPADSCIDCHMPRYGSADIPHTAATDHRILRTPTAIPEVPRTYDNFPLVSFYRGRPRLDEAEDERGRAIGVVVLARTGDAAAVRALRQVMPMLETAVQRDPGDFAAGEARGYALGFLNRWPESLAAFEAVLVAAPNRELALVGAAAAADAVGQSDAAVGFWRRAVAGNPWEPDFHRRLTLLLVKNSSWDDGRTAADAWLRVDPFSAEARTARVTCLLALGDKAAARAEFARLEALAPPDLRELQIRFERKLR